MRFAAFLFAVVLVVSSAFAVVPGTMTYQAIFTDLEGNVMPDGVYTIGFHIFTGPTGGPPVWSEWQEVTVTDGVFEVILGTIFPLTIQDFLDPEGNGQWLSLEYNQTWMHPRQFISSVPYALIACYADSARVAGNTSTGAYHETQFPDDQIENDELVLESGTFTLNTISAVTFFTTSIVEHDDSDGMLYRGRIDIIDGLGSIVASSMEVKQISPADLNIQGLTANLPAGTYFLRLTLWTTDEAATVWLENVDFGVTWVPNQTVVTTR